MYDQNANNKELEGKMDTSLKACKACGEIGHLTKECPDEWPHCDDYPTGVTCFLCEGNNHVTSSHHFNQPGFRKHLVLTCNTNMHDKYTNRVLCLTTYYLSWWSII